MRSVCTATGPTSASLGVRTPPVSTTVRSGRGLWVRISATRMLLVTTVRLGTDSSSPASRNVVVPAVMPIARPGVTRPAATRAIADFSSVLRSDLASNPGSSAL